MQSRPVAHLAHEIKKMRRFQPPLLYRKICVALGIRKENGQPDPGLAKLIEQGYEPRKESTRARLGLPPKIKRHAYNPDEPALIWWRNSITSEQRRDYIRTMYDVFAKK